MLVKNWMTEDIITVNKDDSLATAVNLFRRHDIHILPVVKGDTALGIISASDIKQETDLFSTLPTVRAPDKTVPERTVAEFMVTDVITIFFDHTVEETAEILIKNNISSAPVINHNQKLVGVITQTDLLRAIVTFTGASRRGILFAFIIDDRKGSINNLTDVINKHGARIASILTTDEATPKGYFRAYIRMFGIDRFKLRALTEELKKKASLVYMIDRLEIRKESTREQPVQPERINVL